MKLKVDDEGHVVLKQKVHCASGDSLRWNRLEPCINLALVSAHPDASVSVRHLKSLQMKTYF